MKERYLRRYTDVLALIYLLTNKKITLLDPQSWDDSNDSYYLRLYRRREGLKSVLAVCFTQASEKYQYWRVFTDGTSGACIKFKRTDLIGAFSRVENSRWQEVEYLSLTEARKRIPKTPELPFLKRYAFSDEKEFRIIYDETKNKLRTFDIPIPLSCIDKVTLNPWLPEALFDDTRQLLRSIPGCRNLAIERSTLISNDEWKNLAG